jgi:uncharacterized membrane protein
MGLLLEATLVGISLVIARLFGIAIIALGITWWLMRGDVSRQLRMAPGFIIYNLGVGALVLVYALEAASPVPISWAVALAHLLAGFGSSATLVMRSRPAGSGMARPSPVVAPVDVKRRVR